MLWRAWLVREKARIQDFGRYFRILQGAARPPRPRWTLQDGALVLRKTARRRGALLQPPLDFFQQDLQIKGLGQEIITSALPGHRFHLLIGRKENNGKLSGGLLAFQVATEIASIPSRHPDIEEQQVRHASGKGSKSGPIPRTGHLIAHPFQKHREDIQHGRIIIGDQDFFLASLHSASSLASLTVLGSGPAGERTSWWFLARCHSAPRCRRDGA